MPINAISVIANANYRGPEGYNKYSPFSRINLVAGDVASYNTLVDQRKNLLYDMGVFPAELTLTVNSWAARVVDESTGPKSPPLVVISSNSSNYIKTGLGTVDSQLVALGLANFNNISDLRAFKDATPSPPIYCPKRLGPPNRRNVYVVVQYSEYKTYKAALAGYPGIYVVGFSFDDPLDTGMLTGFGAARYAAIEFCKQLRTQAGNPWGLAWLFDDNVVGLTSVPSLTAVEAALGTDICAGFSGLPEPQNRTNTQTWINGVPPAQKEGLGIPALPASARNPKTHGLVQQAACWNIEKLTTLNLNFSPIFVASKEDVSFANCFDANPFSYKFYYSKIIRKETRPGYDDSDGAKAVNASRASYARQFSRLERTTPIQDIPPPPSPSPPPTTLGPYIATVVVPNSTKLSAPQKASVDIRQTAACQAIESVITTAIKGAYTSHGVRPAGYLGWVGQANLDAIFRPANVGGTYSAALTVTRRDVP